MRMKAVLRKIAIPVLAGLMVVGGLTGLAAAGSTGDAPDSVNAEQNADEQSPSYKGSISIPQEQDTDEAEDKEEDSNVENEQEGENDTRDESAEEAAAEQAEEEALAAQAKISVDDALAAAEAAYPEYTAETPEIGNENGTLIYEVEMTNPAGKSFEVKLDAGNAQILAVEDESEEDED